MKADAGQIQRALDRPDPGIRLILLYGPDESGSRALATRLDKAMGAEAERIDISGAQLKEDPARLADEAASISLFGGARHIRVDPAGDEIIDAAQALLEAPSAGNPVVVIAGNLRKDAKLVKLALASPTALAFASYLPEGRAADQVAVEIARELGLRIDSRAAQAVVAATNADRALIARELEKLALFVDASPDDPKPADTAAFETIGAVNDESDLSAIVDAVMGGRPEQAAAELALIGAPEAIGAVRAVLRRLAQIAPLRAEVAAGQSVNAVMASAGKAIFWKDQKVVAGLLQRWSPDRIATAMTRLAALERAYKRSGAPGMILIGEELLTIARVAASARR
nr:DNA polymerase III subunit delta [Sphingomonas sp. Y57]